jgi:predicted nucleotidyltransferase
LVEAFHPERIYLFGSQARGTATDTSDVDLLVIVSDTGEPGYRRDQAAYAAVGDHLLPLDILVFTREEFEARAASPASLPATVHREGRTLYAA